MSEADARRAPGGRSRCRPGRPRAGGVVLGLTLAFAGCGGGGGGGGGTTVARTLTEPATLPKTVESAPAPRTPAPSTSTSTPGATTAAKPRTTTSPEAAPGGAGDESGIRVPAGFNIARGRLQPPGIALPAFLRIAFTVRNSDPRAHTVLFHGHRLTVPAHRDVSTLVDGLRKGRYPVLIDGRRAGTITTGVQPGP